MKSSGVVRLNQCPLVRILVSNSAVGVEPVLPGNPKLVGPRLPHSAGSSYPGPRSSPVRVLQGRVVDGLPVFQLHGVVLAQHIRSSRGCNSRRLSGAGSGSRHSNRLSLSLGRIWCGRISCTSSSRPEWACPTSRPRMCVAYRTLSSDASWRALAGNNPLPRP